MSGSGDHMDTETVTTPEANEHPTEAVVAVNAPARGSHADDAREVVFDIDDLSVFYGAFRAVRNVNLDIRKNEITALIGPSGLRQDDRAPVPEPDERPGGGRAHRREGQLPRRRPVRRGGRPRRGPSPHRHGVPEAEPVPQVDLRQRRVRAEDRRHEGEHGRPGGGVPPPRRALGRGQGQAQGVGHGALRRPAAAAVHRPSDRDPAGRDPDGRAVLGARPDRHARRSRT